MANQRKPTADEQLNLLDITPDPILDKTVLADFGFIPWPVQEGERLETTEIYRGWEIYLEIPNGGIVAVNITQQSTGERFTALTEGQFDYFHYDGVVGFAKQAINAVFQ